MPLVIPTCVRAVFFDAVGTLIVPEPPAPDVYSDTAARHGLSISPTQVSVRFLAAIRKEDQTDRAANWITNEARETARWQAIVYASLEGADDPEICFRELYSYFGNPTAWRVKSDVVPLLARLHNRDWVLGMGSNFDSRLLKVVDGLPELVSFRENLVVSAEVGHRKPSKAFFHAVVARASCDPREVLFVGDDPENDFQGATGAGLAAVLLDRQDRYPGVNDRIASLLELS